MKRSPLIAFIVAISFLLYSCNSEFPAAYSDYSFSKAQLKIGIVNKYYTSIISHSSENKGHVTYRSFQLLSNDTIEAILYNAAKEVTGKSKHILSDEGRKLIERIDYHRSDTVLYEIIIADPFRWEKGRTSLNLTSHSYNEYKFTDSIKYTIGPEIVHLNLPALVVNKTTQREVYRDGAFWNSFGRENKVLYAKNLDMVLYEYHGEENDIKFELIEQMSLSDFNKIEIPYTERIAFIDPDESWSPEGFEVCTNRINDYYNWDTPELEGGKKELEDFVEARYDPDGFKDQSGYLSIHFVINCRGETGRFIERSHSLDFKEDTFSNKIKDQLMSIIREKKGWIPQVNTEINERKDVYHYVTFRIENGRIDEILP